MILQISKIVKQQKSTYQIRQINKETIKHNENINLDDFFNYFK